MNKCFGKCSENGRKIAFDYLVVDMEDSRSAILMMNFDWLGFVIVEKVMLDSC